MAHHGSSPAAWTAVVIGLVGAVVAGVGSVIPDLIITLIGVVIMVAAGLVGYFMGRIVESRSAGTSTSRTAH
ncbi:hypothetical protein KLP28_01965 [Nocardioidaceae bacterium]|nr:hypothetical protein KLP28_01965 [Nocardioidaceae bacterium]